MLIENYKGVSIFHNQKTDEFYTNLVINKTHNGKKEVIQNGRLQKTRELIDKFLAVSAKKPAIKKAWLKTENHYGPSEFELVDVVIFNNITKNFVIKKQNETRLEELGQRRSGRSSQLFIKCKENDAIIKDLQKRGAEYEKMRKASSCAEGKLIPLSEEFDEED